jgi:hypothetical protein
MAELVKARMQDTSHIPHALAGSQPRRVILASQAKRAADFRIIVKTVKVYR